MTGMCSSSVAALSQIFVWKHNSLAAYITQADPYIAADQNHLLSAVKSIADQDLLLARELDQVLADHGVPAGSPTHDHSLADLNYLSIDYLATVLLKKLQAEADFCKANLKTDLGQRILKTIEAQISLLSRP